jgi:hypothetical protein
MVLPQITVRSFTEDLYEAEGTKSERNLSAAVTAKSPISNDLSIPVIRKEEEEEEEDIGLNSRVDWILRKDNTMSLRDRF